PEWGASPAKPSEHLRVEARRRFSSFWSAYGVPCWLYLRIRSRPFSTAVCSRAILCARMREPRINVRASDSQLRSHTNEREDCADVFAASTHGPGSGPGQDQVAGADGLPGKARSLH